MTRYRGSWQRLGLLALLAAMVTLASPEPVLADSFGERHFGQDGVRRHSGRRAPAAREPDLGPGLFHRRQRQQFRPPRPSRFRDPVAPRINRGRAGDRGCRRAVRIGRDAFGRRLPLGSTLCRDVFGHIYIAPGSR